MSDTTPSELPYWHWAFSFTIEDPATDESYQIIVEAVDAWNLYELAHRIGRERSYQAFRLGARAASHPWTSAHEQVSRQTFDDILRSVGELFNNETDPEEIVLQLTYPMLYEKKVTRDQAAEWASSVLQRHISTDTWRKRVDRWAKKKGLPKVEMRKQREGRTDN